MPDGAFYIDTTQRTFNVSQNLQRAQSVGYTDAMRSIEGNSKKKKNYNGWISHET